MADELSAWLARSGTHPDLRFGHARYHAHTLENTDMWRYLLAGHSSAEPIAVVAPESEIVAVKSVAALGVQKGLLAFTYRRFVDFVEGVRTEGRWHEIWQSDHWAVMVVVEPHMPVDCALALTMVTRWAAARPSTIGLRILTVSTEEYHPEMVALLESQGVPEPPRFLVPDLPQAQGKEIVQIVPGSEADLAEKLKSRVVRNNGKQAIIYFRPWEPLLQVLGELEGTGWAIAQVNPLTLPDGVELAVTAGTLPSRSLHVMGEFRSPFPLAGFDHIHVVLSSASSRKVFGSVSGQMTEISLPLSKQEKQEQLLWAYRWLGSPLTVSVYIDHPTLPEFLDAGHPHRQLYVNNEQLGSFVSALAAFDSWGIDPLPTARCFSPDRDVLTATVGRLTEQRLLTTHETGRLGLRLRDKEVNLFKAAMSILDYDHRLAYFMAQRTGSSKVIQTKSQLASLLAVGKGDLFRFYPGPTGELEEDRDTLATKCWGYSRPLSWQGTVWMALGLWKQAMLASQDLPDDGRDDILVPGTTVAVDRLKSYYIMEASNQLGQALLDLNMGVVFTLVENEDGELREAQCLELQRHLFYAFHDQLVAGVPAGGILSWQDMSSKGAIRGFQRQVGWFVDPDEFRGDQSTDFVWGIYAQLSRSPNGQEVYATDWTWIPPEILEEYDEQREIEGSF